MANRSGSGSYQPLDQSDPDPESAQDIPLEHIRQKEYIQHDLHHRLSSESSEEEGDEFEVYSEKMLKGQGDEEEGMGLTVGGGGKNELGVFARRSPLRILIYALVTLLVLSTLLGLFAAKSFYFGSGGKEGGRLGMRHITMDHVFNGTFSAGRKDVRWIGEAGDGVFSTEEDGWIKLVDLKSNTTKQVVHKDSVFNERRERFQWHTWQISADMQYLLIKTDRVKQWRWSSHGNYYVHDLTHNHTAPLLPPSSPPNTAYASFSPTSPHSIIYVSSNDIYLQPLPLRSTTPLPPIRITHTGSKTVFNGVPDWVYEEEVFSGEKSYWWSPDSRHVAYLMLDESAVKEYVFPVYNPSGWDSSAYAAYTNFTTMKYPKPGYPNPIASLHIYDTHNPMGASNPATLGWENKRPAWDAVINEVTWISGESLVVKEVDRASGVGSVVHFDLKGGDLGGKGAMGKVVRVLGKKGEEGDDGWIDQKQNIKPLKSGGYLDIVPTPEGYNHIAFFESADSGTPMWVTNGTWEVTDGIGGVDEMGGVVYFTAAAPSTIERHVFKVYLPPSASSMHSTLKGPHTTSMRKTGPESIEPLTDTKTMSYYAASFSPESGFYLLTYKGPEVPYQRIMSVTNTSFEYVLTEHQHLNKTVEEFIRPTVVYGSMMSDGYELNTVELRPPGFDSSGRTKYPVFFQVYNGPGYQLVDPKFNIDWHYYLASALKYVIVRVDGRGTGYKGRKMRNPVRDNLGKWETVDQINAAREWVSRGYVDRSRVGIWGWSYGGFMTAKIAEANAGVHTLAISVAPVIDWRLYDSIYTERYMSMPGANVAGYDESAVRNVTGFDQIDYALAHGSGDDNVHFANTAHLLDLFTANHVRKYRFRMFTDSDHSISTRGAYRELHEWLTAFLVEKWGHGSLHHDWKA